MELTDTYTLFCQLYFMQHNSFQYLLLITTQCGGGLEAIFHAPNSNDWSNLLLLVQMLFTLPVSNGKLERVFSTMKLLKVEKRSPMRNDTLDDLLAINNDRIPFNEPNPDPCINMWWNAKYRRPH